MRSTVPDFRFARYASVSADAHRTLAWDQKQPARPLKVAPRMLSSESGHAGGEPAHHRFGQRPAAGLAIGSWPIQSRGSSVPA
jgi:hypothetical protein